LNEVDFAVKFPDLDEVEVTFFFFLISYLVLR